MGQLLLLGPRKAYYIQHISRALSSHVCVGKSHLNWTEARLRQWHDNATSNKINSELLTMRRKADNASSRQTTNEDP